MSTYPATVLEIRSATRLHTPISWNVHAVEYIRRMRGGAQSHLMRCSDGHYYVVKFPNNPQGLRILANELLGMRLARLLGLPVADAEPIVVDACLIRLSEELVVQLTSGAIPCQAGLCFGSRLPIDPRDSPMLDIMPSHCLPAVENFDDFLGMLVFDLWTGNTDGRQVVFCRQENCLYRAVMIDQGHCFGGAEWIFPESPHRALYWHDKSVYEEVEGPDAFEPWLRRLESIGESILLDASQGIPGEWYRHEWESLEILLHKLDRRRTQVRRLLYSVRISIHNPFPKWISVVGCCA
jgi:hypothetical protein